MREKNIFNSKSIAVLPFRNIGKDENEYFSDGITEEIINALTKIEGLKVTARTSSFFYKNKPLDARHIGNELGVESLLEGSVRIINERVRITAQLIRTDNGFYIWSENFDRDLSDIFKLQDEISLLIADKIRENFGHFDVNEHLVEAPTQNIDAYKSLLKGRELRMRWSSKALFDAIVCFDESISLDSDYADPYFEKGWCIGMLASWGYWDKEKGLFEANQLINLGLKLKSNSAWGHYTKATISFWGHWDYNSSFEHLKTALEINPNLSEVRDAMADGLSGMGNLDEALLHNEIAIRINPLSANLYYTQGVMYYYKREFQKAIKSFNRSLELNPEFVLSLEMKAASYIFEKDEKGLKAHISNSPDLQRPKTCMAVYNAMHGDVFKISREEVTAENVETDEPSLRAWDLYHEIALNNHERALLIFEKRIKERAGQLFNFKNDMFLDPIRDYSKYQELEAEVFHKLKIPEIKQGSKKTSHTSPFSKQELENITERLEIEIKDDKAFVNSELSLKQLASNIQLHPNKLSWLLNNHFGKNFNDFVNQYRIKEFQQLAIRPENQHITLLGLAYDSGFNSKTVFNTSFKKETGMTPKQWVKSNS